MTDTEPPQKTVNAEGIAAAASQAGRRGPPPVHLWNPPFCGDLDMEIRRDGSWFYLGTPIGREALVRLFASVLKLEDGRYYLVTPVEKVGIRVVDAPFVAVDCHVGHGGEAAPDTAPVAQPPGPLAQRPGALQRLTFTTNVGDEVTAGPAHPIRVQRAADGEPSPYVMVRRGLEALIDRKTFYRLVEIATPASYQGEDWLGLHSDGCFFPIIPMRDLQG